MRYYQRISWVANSQYFGNSIVYSSTSATTYIPFAVTMRVAPSALETDGTPAHYSLLNSAGSGVGLTSGPTFAAAWTNAIQVDAQASGGLTGGNASRLAAYGTFQPYLGWSAEL
jgi:hypothetical protein